MDSRHYILDENNEVVPTDLMTWAEGFDKRKEGHGIVKQETLPDGKWVSTVFLGLDHNWGDGPPLLFETMVFPGEDEYGELDMDRYSTYKQAEEGHKRMVEKWLKGGDDAKD